MIEALAIAGGVGTSIALVGVILLAFKLSAASGRADAAKSAEIVARAETAQEQIRANGILRDRDREHERAEKAEAQLADVAARLAAADAHVADLSAKLARVVIERVKSQPPSQDGADAVNSMFSEPILPRGK